jgi:hypothetical protein
MQLLKEKNTYKWVYLRELFKNLKKESFYLNLSLLKFRN